MKVIASVRSIAGSITGNTTSAIVITIIGAICGIIIGSSVSTSALASTSVNCIVIESKKGGMPAPMVAATDAGNMTFKYTSNEIEALVTTDEKLANAYIYIGSLTAKPKQQVAVVAGKDRTGIINVNAELNGQSVIVQCQ